MLRTPTRGIRLACHLPKCRPSHPSRRAFTTDAYASFTPPKVRILAPTIWSLAAVTTIYFACACYEVRRDARAAVSARTQQSIFTRKTGPPTFSDLEAARAALFAHEVRAQHAAAARHPPWWNVWATLLPTESGRVLLATAGLTSGVYAVTAAVPLTTQWVVHVPAMPRNFTLLTSVFAHAGALHLAANMFGLLNFGPVVARSPAFERSGGHLTAFYLSAGVLASLAQHVATAVVPAQRVGAMTGALGASGAIFALLATFAVQYPEAQLGIILLPFSLPAQHALAGFALFDAYGTVFGFRALRFAHAAHLGGMAIGAAYVAWDGNRKIWRPTRRLAYRVLRGAGVV